MVLIVVAVLRLPRTRRLYAHVIHTAPFIAFLAFSIWQSLSVLWSEAPKLGLSDIAARQVFACLALWPLMARWRVLIGAFIAGALAFSVLVITHKLRSTGFTQYINDEIVQRNISPSGLTVAVALAALTGQLRSTMIRAWLAFLPVAAVLVFGIVTLGQRMPFFGGIGCALIALVAPVDPRRINKAFIWRLVAAILATAIAGTIVFVTTGRHRDWIPSVISYVTDETADISPKTVANLTSLRAPLAKLAVAIWEDHPVIGAGASGFGIESKALLRDNPNVYSCSEDVIAFLSTLRSSHNAFLDEASQRGIIGASLFLAVLISCGWWAWRTDPSNATLGMLAVWIALSLTEPSTSRGIPLLILALIVTRCSFIAINRRWLP